MNSIIIILKAQAIITINLFKSQVKQFPSKLNSQLMCDYHPHIMLMLHRRSFIKNNSFFHAKNSISSNIFKSKIRVLQELIDLAGVISVIKQTKYAKRMLVINHNYAAICFILYLGKVSLIKHQKSREIEAKSKEHSKH